MMEILMWFTLFYPAIADCGKLRENSCPKKKKKTFFNTFEINLLLLINTKPAPLGSWHNPLFFKKIIRENCKLLNRGKSIKCVVFVEIINNYWMRFV